MTLGTPYINRRHGRRAIIVGRTGRGRRRKISVRYVKARKRAVVFTHPFTSTRTYLVEEFKARFRRVR